MSERQTLYLLPGLLCDETVWQHQIAALSPRYDVRVPRLLGLDSLAAMAERTLEDAPARFSLAGHSVGGRIAIELHRLAAARIERMMLLDTSVAPLREGEAASRLRLVELAKQRGMRALAETWLPPMLHPVRVGDATLVTPLMAMICRVTPQGFEGQVYAMLNRPDAAGELLKIKCPVTFAVGRQDAWSPLALHEQMHAQVVHSKLVVIEDCGHMSPIERPEAVTAALHDWLRD